MVRDLAESEGAPQRQRALLEAPDGGRSQSSKLVESDELGALDINGQDHGALEDLHGGDSASDEGDGTGIADTAKGVEIRRSLRPGSVAIEFRLSAGEIDTNRQR